MLYTCVKLNSTSHNGKLATKMIAKAQTPTWFQQVIQVGEDISSVLTLLVVILCYLANHRSKT
jgi:hypothetical protein